MKRAGFLLIAAAVGFAGCGNGSMPAAGAGEAPVPAVVSNGQSTPAPAPDTPAKPAVVDSTWDSSCPIPTDSPRAPIGLDRAALVARYGTPAAEARFVLEEAIDPVRRTVRNVLPSTADLKRRIVELAWRRDGCELLVWLADRGRGEVAVHSHRGPADGEH